MALTVALGVAIGVGYLFAKGEAWEVRSRIRKGIKDKLPHAYLLTLRYMLLGATSVWQSSAAGWPGVGLAALLLLAIAPAMSITHRFAFNKITRAIGISKTREWYYLGPSHRTKSDSRYDTMWWNIGSRYWQETCTREGVVRSYKLRFTGAPFILCCAAEAAFGTLAAAAYLWLR